MIHTAHPDDSHIIESSYECVREALRLLRGSDRLVSEQSMRDALAAGSSSGQTDRTNSSNAERPDR